MALDMEEASFVSPKHSSKPPILFSSLQLKILTSQSLYDLYQKRNLLEDINPSIQEWDSDKLGQLPLVFQFLLRSVPGL